MVVLVQILLGIALFFIMNWIGKHSYSIGYRQISLFLEKEDSPAFNAIYRILSPVVYIFLVSAIFYKVGLDRFVNNIYLISLYYLVFRLLFNIVTNRVLLLNWYRQVLQWIAILLVSYYCYVTIISKKITLFPDFSTWSNEIWIIIMIFLYGVLNRIRLTSKSITRRQENYLRSRYKRFKNRYGSLIDEKIQNEKLKSLFYAVMIYEDFNRPKVIRLIENTSHILSKREHSLGLMQTKTQSLIDDKTSVKIALDRIANSHKQQIKFIKNERRRRQKEIKQEREKLFNNTGIYVAKSLYKEDEKSDWDLMHAILKDYNPDIDYAYEVSRLQQKISSTFGYSYETTLWDN